MPSDGEKEFIVSLEMRKRMLGALACLLSFALAVAGLVAIPAGHAAEAATETGSGSITFEYKHSEVPVTGVDVELHQVATWDKNWNAQPTDKFKEYQVDWPQLGDKSQDLRVLANTLAGYVKADDIEPMRDGKTGADGTITFDGFPDGLYLIVFGSYANGDLTCEGGAQLVSLPTSTDKADTTEGVTVKAEAKSDCEITPPNPPEEPKEDITVIKVWEDDNDADHKRPGKIVAQLFKDGVLYDEIELNESNGWKHTWTGLDKDHEWTVVEKTVPEGYTTSTDREGTTITIVNKHEPEPDKPDKPDEPEPKPEDPNTPDKPGTPDKEISKTGAAVTGAVLIAAALLGIGTAVLAMSRKRRS